VTGTLEAIWIKRVRLGPMDPVHEATLVAGSGIVGNADQGRKRQVTVISADTWDGVIAELGVDVDPAARRANLLVRGIDLRECRGSILEVGACRIELMGETRPCERMDAAAQGLRDALRSDWRGGAFGVVLDDGVIRVGDTVRLLGGTA
jgi:MOSC domain-containing protein YiiM